MYRKEHPDALAVWVALSILCVGLLSGYLTHREHTHTLAKANSEYGCRFDTSIVICGYSVSELKDVTFENVTVAELKRGDFLMCQPGDDFRHMTCRKYDLGPGPFRAHMFI